MIKKRLKKVLQSNYQKLFAGHIHDAAELFENGQYEEAADKFYKILDVGVNNVAIFKLTIVAYFLSNNCEAGLNLHQKYIKIHEPDSDDFMYAGLLKSELEKYEEAMLDFNKSIKLNPFAQNSIRNKGYIHSLFSEYEKAILHFDTAIVIDPNDAYSYANRGLAKIKLGKEKEGKDDINQATIKKPSSPYAFRNLGIYYFDKRDYQNALVLFEKANQFDPSTHLIQEYIDKTKNKIINGD